MKWSIGKRQKYLLIKWLFFLGAGETAIEFISPFIIFLSMGIIFSIALLLRWREIYPGKEEPLILDLSTALLSFLMSGLWFFSPLMGGEKMGRLILPLLLIPHIIYIFQSPNP